MREITKRTLTIVVMVPLVSAYLFFAKRYEANWAVGLLITGVAFLSGLEYVKLIGKNGIEVEKYSFLTLIVLLEFSYSLLPGRYSGLIFWAVVVLFILWYIPGEEPLKKVSAALFGVLYIPYLLQFFYLIYEAPSGGWLYIMLLLIMVWCYDIGAYLIGSRFGRHPFAPSISPRKSVEGVVGGFIFTLIGANLTPIWVNWVAWIPHIVTLSLLVATAVQLGDLFESKLKRVAGVKDSGSLFPGHGGMLDRIDGLLFALPVFYFYFHYILKFV